MSAMAKSKSKSKSKFDAKDFLLKKGEYVALTVAGIVLLLLLMMGVSSLSDAANPAEISKEFASKSDSINKRINDPNDPKTPDPLPGWTEKKSDYKMVALTDFPQYGTLFDPTGRPDSKRQNPKVFGIEEYQVDLVRGAMPGYDIIYVNDGKDAQIAVKVTKKTDELNKDKLKSAFGKLKKRGEKLVRVKHDWQQQHQGMPIPGGATGNPGVPASSPPAGVGSNPSRGMMGSMGSLGMGGSSFDTSAQRTDTTIAYVPLEDLDDAISKNKQPAQTVIPLRMVIVNCTVPLKRQLEEVKKAMRFQSLDQAREYVHYDGFEVRRRITQLRPTGEPLVISDWAPYKYEDQYIEKIDGRKLSDHVEGAETGQGAYLPYFYRYEDLLVMPLPELVPELGTYPPIRSLKSILSNIEKLEQAGTSKIQPSDLLERLNKKNSRKESIFVPKSTSDTGADAFGSGFMIGAKMGKGKGSNLPKDKNDGRGALDNQTNVDIDHLLLRFVDCNVQPGLTYEYQIQLRMVNPNFDTPQWVSNPADAKKQVLTSPWVPLAGSLTVPTEDFLFAFDRTQYSTEVNEDYKEMKFLKNVLQVKDNQAVVQGVKWMEEIRMEGKHEPVGGWVVAEMPVSRGDYIGKKTFVKLPLWSSASDQYVFRELSADVLKKSKDQQPKGWLVDFSSKAVLVDFEGGKVTGRLGSGRTLPSEEVSTEMLIVRPDGTLQVRRSDVDTADPTRKQFNDDWDKWLKKVESRVETNGAGPENKFERPMSK
jgi:hypothetical protein